MIRKELWRVGTTPQTEQFDGKLLSYNKIKNTIEDYIQEDVEEDCFFTNIENKFTLAITTCGYGVHLYVPFRRFMYDLAEEIFDYEPMYDGEWNHLEKYYANETQDEHYPGIAFLPGGPKHNVIDFDKLDSFVFDFGGFIKIHPLTDGSYTRFLRDKYGDKLIPLESGGGHYIHKTDMIGVTASTELLLYGSVEGKKIFDLNVDDYYSNGSGSTYPGFYRCFKEGRSVSDFMSTLVCGIIPWHLASEKPFIEKLVEFYNDRFQNWKELNRFHI